MEPPRLFIRRTELPVPADIETEARTVFPDETEPLVDIWRYWRMVRKHLRLAIGITAASLVLTAAHVMMETPIYTSEATILIEPNAADAGGTLQNLVEIEVAANNSDQYYKTQCAILRSRNLAISVIRNLDLRHNPAFAGKPRSPGLFSLIFSGAKKTAAGAAAEPGAIPIIPDESEPADVPLPLVHKYLAMLGVTPVPDTNLVKITFASPDARLSAQLSNAHIEAYSRGQIDIRGHQNEEAEQFLRNKLVEIKEQLEKSEAALNDYRRAKGIIPGLISLDGKDAVVLDRLTDLSKDLTHAQVARIGLEAQVALINRHQYASLPAVMSDGEIKELDRQLNGLYAEASALATEFKADYPPLLKVQARIRTAQTQMAMEIRKKVDEIEAMYREATERENELQAEMDRQRAETLTLNDSAAQYAILQRDVDTNRQLYEAILTRMKDVAVASGSEDSNVSVINSAEVPTIPTSPKKGREMTLALIVGLTGGIGLAFLLEFLDNTLKNPEEAENYLRVPSLGVVPEFSSITGAGSPYGSRELLNDRPASALPPGRELVTAHGSYSSLGEAYRNLRTALLLSRAGGPPQVTMITSATSREGKTVTAVNTAVMLAQSGARTLLIDADLRRPRCHRVLTVDNQLGLTEVLTGSRELGEVVRRTEIENFDFLGSGSAPPNPTELLGSTKMLETLTALRKIYEYIIVDTSPVLPVSDPLVVAQLADGIMVVANAVATPRQQVRTAVARLEYARGKILGVVLNRIKIHSPDYQYYYHHEYYGLRTDGDTLEEARS
jgi:capsular exopolysaccharide synthesis family protein